MGTYTLIRFVVSGLHEVHFPEWPCLRVSTYICAEIPTIGLHFAAAEAIDAYPKKAEITRGPLFRPRKASNSGELANRHMTTLAIPKLVLGYLKQLPGGLLERDRDDPAQEKEPSRCAYAPHSLRATTATLLFDAGVDIAKVQESLGHRHITTTQIYDKRRRTAKESASHDVPSHLRRSAMDGGVLQSAIV
jgi:integrase